MRYLTLAEVLALHGRLVSSSGGAAGLRDLGRLQSAVAQPSATFDGQDLYPSLVDKAAALCFALVQGHPFVDGNKRIGHASTEVFLVLNGLRIDAAVDEQEALVLRIASGKLSLEALTDWLRAHVVPIGTPATDG